MKDEACKSLVEGVKKHDEAAFNELFRRYHRLVHYIAFQLTKNEADADDVVQDTFLQVQTSIHDLKDVNLIKAWIGRIAYSKSITLLRKKKDQQMSDKQIDYLSKQAENRKEYCPNEQSHHDSDMQILHQCISELKLPYREVLILYYFVQLSIKEICVLLQIPEGTVKSRLLYGKKNLKERISQYERTTQDKITFRSASMESMLIAASSAMVSPMPKTAFFHFKNITIPTSTMVMSMKVALATTVFAGAAVIGNEAYQAYQQSNVPAAIVANEKQVAGFPEIFYQDKKIENAREAYELLLTKAHCEAEIMLLTDKQQKEIMAVYDTLITYGGIYPQLLTTYGWKEKHFLK